MPLDLTAHSDFDVLHIVGNEQPEFIDILAAKIDEGRSDEEIVRLVAMAGGSAQAMRYAAKCCRALRQIDL